VEKTQCPIQRTVQKVAPSDHC